MNITQADRELEESMNVFFDIFEEDIWAKVSDAGRDWTLKQFEAEKEIMTSSFKRLGRLYAFMPLRKKK